MSKLLIIGFPQCGKTTMAKELGDARHCDDIIHRLPWSAVSDEVAKWLEQPGPWIIEGCAGVRGLRKWLAKNPGLPDFNIVYLDKPYIPLTGRQIGFAAQIASIWRECQDEMDRRRV